MKLFVCISLLVLFSPAKSDGDSEAEKLFGEELKKGAGECLKEFKVDEQDFEALKRFETPKTEGGKCFMKCTLQKMEVLKENKYSGEGFLEKVKGWLKDNPEKYSKIEKMINHCKTEVEKEYTPSEEDKCGITVAVMKCFHSHEEETKQLREILERITKKE